MSETKSGENFEEVESPIPDPEYVADAYMSQGLYKQAEGLYREALQKLGKKTWKNRKEYRRLENKLYGATDCDLEEAVRR